MLKLQPSLSNIPDTKIKCGEIFCRSFKDFTIFCTLCQMKSFQIDDFVLHITNVHLKNKLANETDVFSDGKKQNFENGTRPFEKSISDKTLTSGEAIEIYARKESTEDIWNNNEWSSPNNSENESWEEENLRVFKNATNNNKLKRNNDQLDGINVTEEQSQTYSKEANKTSNTPRKPKVNEYSCTECHTIFLQKKCLDQHVRDFHNGYKCSLCDKRFNRTSHVECHLKTHTTEKRFICPEINCGRGFIDEDYLKRHLEVHTMERNFICGFENCGKAFQTQRRLASHEYTHKISKKFVCDMCGYCCRSNPQLITHQRVHTGEKPFPCEVCKKPFISKVALQEHMISHSKTRPHICSICNRAFANRRVLVRHSFIHTEEKTFKCKLCESSFKHPNSLQGHMRHVHKEPKHKTTL